MAFGALAAAVGYLVLTDPPAGMAESGLGDTVIALPSLTAPAAETVAPPPEPKAPETADPASNAEGPAGGKSGAAPAESPQQAAIPPPSPTTGLTLDPALVEPSAFGPLPRVAPDGRRPRDVYARPFNNPYERPMIAVIVTGLGLSEAATNAAIQELPGEITLAFSPYAASRLNEWIELARAAGHETLLSLPMEPESYPRDDPGPHTLLTGLQSSENLERLRWMLSRFTGYVGVIDDQGSRFTASEGAMLPILGEIGRRGLLYVDSRPTDHGLVPALADRIGLPRAVNDRVIDNPATRNSIDARLAEVEEIARRDGAAIALAFHYPVTIERLRAWARQVEARGFVLAPVSAVVSTAGQ
ncbi:MAG: divergent polysaccharide deacetylase family protein [Rhodospirillaceae bacterium]|nr:divergent polysaccharide deacetylase family protein [Rhodospirillaceae bacterium]